MASFNGNIYLITNIFNGLIYIGQSSTINKYYLGSGVKIKKAIKYYGRDHFKKEVLIDNIKNIDQLNCLEEFYIKLYNSTEKSVGYNIRKGGKNKSFKHTSESINKIKLRSNQPDNKARIRLIQKQAVQSNIGRKCTKNSLLQNNKTRFGVNRKIKIHDKENNLITYCDFISEASKLTGVSISSIKNNLCGLSSSTRRFLFTYKIIN